MRPTVDRISIRTKRRSKELYFINIRPRKHKQHGYKKHCWPNAEMHPKITSRAKAKPIIWYSKLKTKELADL